VDPTRAVPTPFGQPAAMETMGTIAAPLLGGFAFASIGIILSAQDALRWADQALVLVVGAVLLFVTSLQATFNARRHYVPPDQWAAWLGLAPSAARRAELQRRWTADLAIYRRWIEVARVTYNLAIVALLAATAVLLVPAGHLAAWRAAAIALATMGALGEVGWVLTAEAARRRRRDSVRLEASRTGWAPRSPQLRPSSESLDQDDRSPAT
jgi:MFS family permease